MTQRNTRQKSSIYTELCSRCDHPTAQELFEDLKQKDPNISIATVYRNLKALAEKGTVLRIQSDDADHFDANTEPHNHFTCRKCGRITDIAVSDEYEFNKLPVDFDGEIESYALMFYGVCAKCK